MAPAGGRMVGSTKGVIAEIFPMTKTCSLFYFVCGVLAVLLTLSQLYYTAFASVAVAAEFNNYDAPLVESVVAVVENYTSTITQTNAPSSDIVARAAIAAIPKDKVEREKPLAAQTEKHAATELHIFDNAICNGTATEIILQDSGTERKMLRLSKDDPKFVKVLGNGMVELSSRAKGSYTGVLMELDGCFDLRDLSSFYYAYFRVQSATSNTTTVLTDKRQISDTLQRQFSTMRDTSQPHTRIIFSASSSHYFGYQVYANAFAFLQTNQTNSSWMRLVTAGQPDDLSERFPTFTAPKSPYSATYTPFNKPDVIDKWFHSKDAPHPEDTIVVIDPDNWLLKDIEPWTHDVSPKHAVAMQAYYHRSRRVCQRLWQLFCLVNCEENRLELVGVPYLIKASDLKDVAPLWKQYTVLIKNKWHSDESFRKEYGPIGLQWCMEMFGFNFANAHLGITTKVVTDLQVRDVETTRPGREFMERPMIHAGRAWFPKQESRLAGPWRSSDDGGLGKKGIQVWCKCNATAGEVQPWPIPKRMDFVSMHTLRILHESREYFGPVPVNASFRNPDSYYWAAP